MAEYIEREVLLNNLKQLAPAHDKIIITLDGNTVSMKFCKNNKVVTFSDLDCFDDCGNLVVNLEGCNETEKPKYKEVHRKAKVGEYVRLVAEHGDGTGDYGEKAYDRCGIYQVEAVDDLAKIRSKCGGLFAFWDNEYVVLEGYKPEETAEKTFVPHLEDNIIGNKLGEIGKETKFVDVVGRKLCVGDVVELFNNSDFYGDRVVVEDDNTRFVMGIRMSCDCKNGHIDNEWKIIKKRSYKDVNNGEKVDGIKFVTEEKPPKYYSGKLVCVESNYRHYWTVGKIYECVDGTLPTDLGSDRCLKKCRDLDDINVRNFARFIELKE